VPFGSDGVFTPESFVDRVNADLANDLGNLLNRTIAMIGKYFDGKIPAYEGRITEFDGTLEDFAMETVRKTEEAMENLEFSIALSTIWQLVSRTNKYIDETQPWVLAKDEAKQGELASVMYHLAESIRIVSVLIQPFMTETPAKIWSQLGLNDSKLTDWDSLKEFGTIPADTSVVKGDPIFPRLETEVEVQFIKDSMGSTSAPAEAPIEEVKQEAPSEADQKPEISIDDFMKVDLRVATVIAAEPVKKADKLLKLQLDLGYEKRQVVSGIAQYYKPDDLVGQKVICVTNLKPVKLRGELSEGMILAGSSDGQLTLATVDQSLPNGAKVK
jgi:methionyl-tRNA synthetase